MRAEMLGAAARPCALRLHLPRSGLPPFPVSCLAVWRKPGVRFRQPAVADIAAHAGRQKFLREVVLVQLFCYKLTGMQGCMKGAPVLKVGPMLWAFNKAVLISGCSPELLNVP